MKTAIRLFILAGMIILFRGCASNETASSDTVKQSEIYQAYSLEYDHASSSLTARSQFRFGGSRGTTLILTTPSKVFFNDAEMPLETDMFAGAYYRIMTSGEMPTKGKFVFVDFDGKKYSNTISLKDINAPDSTMVISLDKEGAVAWTGVPVGDNEVVSVHITDQANNSRSKNTSVKGAVSISLSPDDLEGLSDGNGSVMFERSNYRSLAQGSHLGGKISFRVRSAQAVVTLERLSVKEEEVQ